jgi:hypothetical protein
MKRSAAFILFFLCSHFIRAQSKTDSCDMEISLLTCAPGADLYSIFGHTAIRVQDARRGMDIVYNYGTFDDTDPLFYVNFTNGIMNYSLSAETMDSFMQEYQFEHRNVLAQILNLSCPEKLRLYEALRENTLDQNRIYQYHFHTDNCTTRAARILENNTDSQLVYKNILTSRTETTLDSIPSKLSFRDMIHQYLDKQQARWSEFGIDLFLGSGLDRQVTNIEAIHFLPDYLYRGLDGAKEGNKSMVIQRQDVIRFAKNKPATLWLSPFVVFTILLLAVVLLFLNRSHPGCHTALLIFDITFFSLLGLIGTLMAYLWIGRVDDVCRNNINILWALPTHLIMVWFVRKKPAWIKYYFLTTAILALSLLLGFPVWTQRLNPAVLPLLGIILLRSISLSQKRHYAQQSVVPRQAA